MMQWRSHRGRGEKGKVVMKGESHHKGELSKGESLLEKRKLRRRRGDVYKRQVPNGGGTNILNGLTCATQELANAASIGASHSVILLSDGEDNETNDRTIIPIHAAIAQASAKLFAVGIGEAHRCV